MKKKRIENNQEPNRREGASQNTENEENQTHVKTKRKRFISTSEKTKKKEKKRMLALQWGSTEKSNFEDNKRQPMAKYTKFPTRVISEIDGDVTHCSTQIAKQRKAETTITNDDE